MRFVKSTLLKPTNTTKQSIQGTKTYQSGTLKNKEIKILVNPTSDNTKKS